MERDVQKYFELGLAVSTKKTYRAGINKFVQLCASYNIASPLPVSQSVLCLFISHLANVGLSYGTIKTYLASVRHLQISMNLPEPRSVPMPKLALVERGIRHLGASSRRTRSRLPIIPCILRQIKALWSREAICYDTIMLWAACCMAFFGFFRMGEITCSTSDGRSSEHCVSVADIAVDNTQEPPVIKIHLRSSKTDQFRQGVDIFLGRTGQDLCPVSALLAYLAVRGSAPGPLFRLRDGCYLTKEVFITRVREALSVLGYDEESYAGHSFRIGAATTAAEQGVEDSIIKMLGCWESSAFQRYVRASHQSLAAMSTRLVTPTQ